MVPQFLSGSSIVEMVSIILESRMLKLCPAVLPKPGLGNAAWGRLDRPQDGDTHVTKHRIDGIAMLQNFFPDGQFKGSVGSKMEAWVTSEIIHGI
jgi:hypothetical protein